VRPQLKLLLETLRPNPAYITSRTLDLLASNPGALALYAGISDWPAGQRNIGRFLFLHPAARDIYADWDYQIRGCVARLRALAGTDPDAPGQRLGVYLAEPGTPDYDAMILLDMTASRPAAKPAAEPQH
jgi:hypothetical protein